MSSAKGTGWLTAKKRGRDDEQIERDQQNALLQRRQKRQDKLALTSKVSSVAPKKEKAEKKNIQHKAPTRKLKNNRSRESFETLDSLSDFVVDDDGDSVADSEIDEEESSFDEELLVEEDISSSDDDDDDGTQAKISTMKYNLRDDVSASSNDSEVKMSSFFPKTLAKRTSKPTPLPQQQLQRKASSKVHSTKTELVNHRRSASGPKLLPIPPRNHGANRQHIISLDNSDSDVDDAKVPALHRASNTTGTRNKDQMVPILNDSPDAHDPLNDSDSMMSASELFDHATTTTIPNTADGLRDLEDTPVLPTAIRKKIKKYQTSKSKNVHKKKKSNVFPDDDCSDFDEAVAIACAIEESTKSYKSSNNKNKNVGAATIDILDSPDEYEGGDRYDDQEQHDEEMMGAEYVDAEEYNADAIAAQSILATANELSLRILRTMARWTHSAIDGMIMDGALTLSTIAKNNDKDQSYAQQIDSNNPDHTWISNDTMLQILPNVKLSEYQLIGINWLALLHGMKCEVEGGTKKKYTNVNGILADGKSVFLKCVTFEFAVSILSYAELLLTFSA
jgi:hypothetical protein